MVEQKEVEVNIKLSTGAFYTFNMKPWSTVRTVCEELGKKLRKPEKCIRLSHTGKELQKTHSLDYLGVRAEIILRAEVRYIAY
jgi:hypothetical protein